MNKPFTSIGAISSHPGLQYRKTDSPVHPFFKPDLMAASIYVCEHVMHQRKAQGYLRNTVKTADLKAFQFPEDKVVIINALGKGEGESEHAIIGIAIPGEDYCFKYAVDLAAQDTGLAFIVLIWSCQ